MRENDVLLAMCREPLKSSCATPNSSLGVETPLIYFECRRIKLTRSELALVSIGSRQRKFDHVIISSPTLLCPGLSGTQHTLREAWIARSRSSGKTDPYVDCERNALNSAPDLSSASCRQAF